MSSLGSELTKLRDLVATLPTRKVLPANQLRPTYRVLERVLKAVDITPELPEARLEQVKREILAAQRGRRELLTLPGSILRDAIWLLWPDTSDGLNRSQLRRAILARAAISNSALRRLIDVWLLRFSPDDDTFVDVGRQIDRFLAADHRGILGFWKESHRANDVFNATKGPEQLADRLLKEESESLLTACRLNTPSRANSGYLRAVHLALSDRLPRHLIGPDGSSVFGRAVSFYAPKGSLRFGERTTDGAMADAMVGPWLKNQRQPSERMRSHVLAFLRQHLGDPRVDARQRWTEASESTRSTVRGWLSKLSLDAFFNVVGQFAENAGMDHHWKAREAFWGACLHHNRIEDSWLVLGENVARAIRNNREIQGSFGRLADGNANHSVLLMRIGKTTFAEWSHNGKLRAWAADWQIAPKMFRAVYSRSELTAAGMQFPPPRSRPDLKTTDKNGLTHHPDVWQYRVAELLRRRENFELTQRDWA